MYPVVRRFGWDAGKSEENLRARGSILRSPQASSRAERWNARIGVGIKVSDG
jgi:hypothetical protein